MNALVWKEYRNNRSAVIGGFASIALVYLVVSVFRHFSGGWRMEYPPVPWPHVLQIGAFFSLALGTLFHVWIAADSVAKERQDRSAEFLAYLPISRARALTAKAVVALPFGLFYWLVNVPVLVACRAADPDWAMWSPTILWILAALAALAFGGAWMASCVLSNSAACMAVGLILPQTWYGLVAGWCWWWPDLVSTEVLYIGGGFTLAAAMFTGGGWYYLRCKPE